jgi:hypothetical protein
MNEEIIKYIKEKRPNISQSSLKTYESIIRNLYDKMGWKNEPYDLKLFDKESNKVLEYLKNKEPKKRKTILSALVVITDNKDYRELMLDDIKTYNKNHSKQEIEDKENWTEHNEVEKITNTLRHNANLLYKKNKLTLNDLQEIQNYIIMVLFNGEYIPPRRSKDYVNFKIKNINKEKDNYMNKNEFIFNSYKTAKTYGQQIIEIPKELKAIINKWVKVNPTDYLLFDVNLGPLSNVKMTQRLNKLLGKKASVNALRKSYLSNKYDGLIDMNKDLEKTMKDMGSSRLQETIYIKK